MLKHRSMRRLAAANPVSLNTVSRLLPPSSRNAALEQITSVPRAVPGAEATRSLARRAARRRVLYVAAAAITLTAAPAFALQQALVRHSTNFGRSQPAPPIVRKQFEELFSDNAPPSMNPAVEPLSTRKVGEFESDAKLSTLWVAPTRDGGFCMEFTGLGGGCHQTRLPTTIPLSIDNAEVRPWLIDATAMRSGATSTGARVIFGALLAPSASRLELSYEDGGSAQIPFTWVSEPINVGFFVFTVPAAHQLIGARASSLAAYDDAGDLIARADESLQAALQPSRSLHS